MRTVLRERLTNADGAQVMISLSIQPRTFRSAVWHVLVEDGSRDDWDFWMQYRQGAAVIWPGMHGNPENLTTTPTPSADALKAYRWHRDNYVRMNYS